MVIVFAKKKLAPYDPSNKKFFPKFLGGTKKIIPVSVPMIVYMPAKMF